MSLVSISLRGLLLLDLFPIEVPLCIQRNNDCKINFLFLQRSDSTSARPGTPSRTLVRGRPPSSSVSDSSEGTSAPSRGRVWTSAHSPFCLSSSGMLLKKNSIRSIDLIAFSSISSSNCQFPCKVELKRLSCYTGWVKRSRPRPPSFSWPSTHALVRIGSFLTEQVIYYAPKVKKICLRSMACFMYQ